MGEPPGWRGGGAWGKEPGPAGESPPFPPPPPGSPRRGCGVVGVKRERGSRCEGVAGGGGDTAPPHAPLPLSRPGVISSVRESTGVGVPPPPVLLQPSLGFRMDTYTDLFTDIHTAALGTEQDPRLTPAEVKPG